MPVTEQSGEEGERRAGSGSPPAEGGVDLALLLGENGALPASAVDSSRFARFSRSLSAKVIATLVTIMVITFALLGYSNVRLHRKNLEDNTLAAAERVSDLIKRSTRYHMLRNDRDALYQMIATIGQEPGIVRIRIFNQEGRISYSTDSREISNLVDKGAEQCYACHAYEQPLSKLNRPDRFRIYRANGSGRVLGIITPIENQPECANAACHAHPAEQQILGVLDTNMSLARADQNLAASTKSMILVTVLATLAICFFSVLFVVRVVDRPVKALTIGTEKLTRGELGTQIPVHSNDELGELASSFNAMSLQLRAAHQQITSWARTLEQRVEEKTQELKKTHEHMLQVETMTSLGKMAAVVAHEINNPLAGILTYAKLIKRWLGKGELTTERREEINNSLDLIESESKRCGDLVKGLLSFSRTAPMNLAWTDVNSLMDRCAKLVQHQLELNNIELQMELATDLPSLHCDGAQLEQVLLALTMNAIDAMPRGGNLWLRTRALPASSQVELQVRDDGMGIPPDIMHRIFEPFLTTKESGKGVGLGLAIAKGIVERHHGQIQVDSQLGRGTTFHIFLPVDPDRSTAAPAEPVLAAQTR